MERLLDILILVILTVNHCLLFLSVPSYAEANHSEVDGLYVGCFKDGSPRSEVDIDDPQKCLDNCFANGYLLAGLRIRDKCWCGDDPPYIQAPRSECSSRCSNGTTMYECGAYSRISLYQTTVSGEYWSVYTWGLVVGASYWFDKKPRIVGKEFIVVGDKAGTSVFKRLKPYSLIPYEAEFCEWEANHSGGTFGNSFYKLRTTAENLRVGIVCLTVETTSMEGPLILSFEHKSELVFLGEKEMKAEGVLRFEAELPPEYKWQAIRLHLEFPSLTNFKEVKRIASCIPGVKMDTYRVSLREAETRSLQKFYPRDPGAEGGTCENGGIFTGSGCICRVGFSGPSCENICGENSFGPNCEGRCSSETSGCLGKLFCKSGEGCGCANGFTGEYCKTS